MIPFFALPPEVRKVIYTTNMIESISYQLRKMTKTRGHFPIDDAVIKLLYLGCRELGRTTRAGRGGRPNYHWKIAMNPVRRQVQPLPTQPSCMDQSTRRLTLHVPARRTLRPTSVSHLWERMDARDQVNRFVEAPEAMKFGDPLDPATEFGPLVSEQHFEEVKGYVKSVAQYGGRILTGCLGDGWFVKPTVLVDMPLDSPTSRWSSSARSW